MQPAVLIRLRPAGPWRYGPGDGGQDRVDSQYRSDRLYSALTLAAKRLGWMEEWLEATARSSSSSLAFTSLFPYQGSTLFVAPPATLWPPPPSLLTTPSPVFLSKIRWDVASFVPVSLVETILLGQQVLADQWLPDPESSCLLRRDRLSVTPFRTVLRTGAAVDRITSTAPGVQTSACVEFEPGSGLWTLVRFRDEAARSDWGQRLTAAFRLLSDTGFGGRRSSGWGQTEVPEFQEGTWPGLLLPKLARAIAKAQSNGQPDAQPEVPQHWLLSLFTPGESDQVDWSSGEYRVVVRGGYIEAAAPAKKQIRMIAEGSVLVSQQPLVGTALDVAPDGFEHPVYRSGIALSLQLPPQSLPGSGPAESELDQILSELESAAAQESASEELANEDLAAGDLAITAPAEPPAPEPLPVEEPAPVPESPIDEPVEQPSVEEPASHPESDPPGSPEIESAGEWSPETEPQDGGEQRSSIEDPDATGGGGPDYGI